MECPVCKNVTLLVTERHGIEIDYCPRCRGVWLDRGELDKIIERASGGLPPEVSRPGEYGRPSRDYDDYPPPYDHERGYPPKKKRGFLSELFDFD